MGKRQEIEAVLFDLDGTLLPMDQSVFIKEYFKSVSEYMVRYGIEPKKMIDFTVEGSAAMARNDGSCTNKEIFWETFFKCLGNQNEEFVKESESYYSDEFKNLRNYTSENPYAERAVEAAHREGRKVVLATSPIFPMTAQCERLSWTGLKPENFDLITSYENSKYCKPNPDYYREICEKINVAPENCLMIGNDEKEDMKAASEAGLNCFLVTDCRIMSKNFVWTGERGSFEQAVQMLEIL